MAGGSLEAALGFGGGDAVRVARDGPRRGRGLYTVSLSTMFMSKCKQSYVYMINFHKYYIIIGILTWSQAIQVEFGLADLWFFISCLS
jgi:hypothetical protein